MRQFSLALVAAVVALQLGPSSAAHAATGYVQTNLSSDFPAVAAHLDPNLVNPWGMASSATSPIWVADNGSGLATLYDGAGVAQSLVVTMPPGATAPTAVVFNTTSDFELTPGNKAIFLFASEGGTIAGWNPAVAATSALIEVSNANADYKGLAIGATGGSNFLYAANFLTGAIDVFDATFAATTLSGNFTDPSLPAGYRPFNIQNVGGVLFVTYAVDDGTGHEVLPGAGSGIVDRFDTNGLFLSRFATGGLLDAPWGLALAPGTFGDLAGALLVGNFGDGRINAFDATTGAPIGTLNNATGTPIVNAGLRGLLFGNGGSGGLTDELFFTADVPGSGSVLDRGLFGKLAVAPPNVLAVPTLSPGMGAVLALLLAGAAVAVLARRRATGS